MNHAAPTSMLNGDSVYRIAWIPGTDKLVGYHPSGARRESDDPIELWEWLLDYTGDEGGPLPPAQPQTSPPPPTHHLHV